MIDENVPGFLQWLQTPAGRVARISTRLRFQDRLGACKVRWGINRMKYAVPAGLYAIGQPDSSSPVIVTANYKMTFDMVRASLAGQSLWMLVLETCGINVWCAAGKGSFGTEELVRRIFLSSLAKIVGHRHIILPLLGAPGVAAHKVKQATGFRVHYGPCTIGQLGEFIQNGKRLTTAMKEPRFSFYDRLVLTPVEMVLSCKSAAIFACIVFLAGALDVGGFSVTAGANAAAAFLGAWLSGVFVTPLLLPVLPSRSFALKGCIVGMCWAILWLFMRRATLSIADSAVALLLILPAASFYSLNFTGCTPFTSRSGVKKELRYTIPPWRLLL